MSYRGKSENFSHLFWVYIIIHHIWKFQSDSLKLVPTEGRRILSFASKINWEKISSKDLARARRLAGSTLGWLAPPPPPPPPPTLDLINSSQSAEGDYNSHSCKRSPISHTLTAVLFEFLAKHRTVARFAHKWPLHRSIQQIYINYNLVSFLCKVFWVDIRGKFPSGDACVRLFLL